jgi:integrase
LTHDGEPFTDTTFGTAFRRWCNAAGLPKRCTAHGLRKAACRRLAEAGCSASQIMAISGHATLREVQRTLSRPIKRDSHGPRSHRSPGANREQKLANSGYRLAKIAT